MLDPGKLLAFAIAFSLASLHGQQAVGPGETALPAVKQQSVDKLLDRLVRDEERIRELEERLARLTAASSPAFKRPDDTTSEPTARAAAEAAAVSPNTSVQTVPEAGGEHDHMINLPGGGPSLLIRGFLDLNLGLGKVANPLVFPLGAPVHNTFQLGEFDLFFFSKLSNRLSFVGEVVFGTDHTNEFGVDIERMQLTFKQSDYFQISGGRYHTAIGYYNTAFHHGTWFQTATGRPFMYYFEDSGGVLPVHNVGVTTTGLVPGTGSLGLHWIAEVGNGRSSDPTAQPVQNFLADKNHKDFNLAFYLKPDWVPGLQIGGSYFRDRLVPTGIPHVNQNIGSLYAVYISPEWEFLNEVVLMSNTVDGQNRSYTSPLAYSQVSRRFGPYRPYFRYQYVNVPNNDPVSIYVGRYQGPSLGLRMDYTTYAALKIQFNRLYQRNLSPANGIDVQVAFTF